MRNDGVIGSIGQQEWLKPTEEALQKLLHKVFHFKGGRQAKNFLHGTWVGHPLHAILTDIPIGAWTTAVAFDALDSMGSRPEYSVAADAAVALGLVGAVGAAATGLTDWQDIDPPARRIGLVHGLLNVASVALFGSSLLARRRGDRTTGRGLAVLGYAISAVAARLGGNLVYGQRIGVDHSKSEDLPDEFTPVLSEVELSEGKPVRAEHNGTPILLVRHGQNEPSRRRACRRGAAVRLPHFDLAVLDAGSQTRLRMDSWAINDVTVANGKARTVPRTLDDISRLICLPIEGRQDASMFPQAHKQDRSRKRARRAE